MSSFQTRDEADVLVVTLDNPAELNDFRTDTFRDALYETVQHKDVPRLVLDLGAADYLSSSGVAILVGLKRRAEARNGKLVLARVQPIVQDLLRIMKLTPYFTIANNVEEGIAAARPVPTA
jgi:anti-sigma B factor antagonist